MLFIQTNSAATEEADGLPIRLPAPPAARGTERARPRRSAALLGRQEEPPVQITTIRFEQTFNTGNCRKPEDRRRGHARGG